MIVIKGTRVLIFNWLLSIIFHVQWKWWSCIKTLVSSQALAIISILQKSSLPSLQQRCCSISLMNWWLSVHFSSIYLVIASIRVVCVVDNYIIHVRLIEIASGFKLSLIALNLWRLKRVFIRFTLFLKYIQLGLHHVVIIISLISSFFASV